MKALDTVLYVLSSLLGVYRLKENLIAFAIEQYYYSTNF